MDFWRHEPKCGWHRRVKSLFDHNFLTGPTALRFSCSSISLHLYLTRPSSRLSATISTLSGHFDGIFCGKHWRNISWHAGEGFADSTRLRREAEPCCRKFRICVSGTAPLFDSIRPDSTDHAIHFVPSVDDELGANRRCRRETRWEARQYFNKTSNGTTSQGQPLRFVIRIHRSVRSSW